VRNVRLILVTGLPGSGKTTLASTLAERFGMPAIGKDLIKEPLLDVLGATDRAQSRRLSNASFAVLFAVARELVAAGTNFILEGNFRPGEHERELRALASPLYMHIETSVHIAQILCHAEESQRIACLAAREHDPLRHPGHRDVDLVAAIETATSGFLDVPAERFVLDISRYSTQSPDTSPPAQALLEALDLWLKVHPVR